MNKNINSDDLFQRIVIILAAKKTIMNKYLTCVDETETLILEYDNIKSNFYKDCDEYSVIGAVKKHSTFLKTACIEVSNYYNNEHRNCFIKDIAIKIRLKDYYALDTLYQIETLETY